MEADPHNDGHDHEAFLVTTRPVRAGEELMWSYSVSQSHRSIAQEPASDGECATSMPSSKDDEEAEVGPRKMTTKQAAARGSAAAPKNREACTASAAAAAAADLSAAGGNAFGAKCPFSISDDEEAEVVPRKIATPKQSLIECPEKSKKPPAIPRMKNVAPPAHSASESETESATEPHLPPSPHKLKPSASQKRTLAPAPQPDPKPPLQTSSQKIKPTASPFPLTRLLTKSTSPEKRCKGCLCVNPCSNLKYCLTPQTDLKKRVRVSKQIE